MKRTELFTKTSKTTPASEVAKNAQLLIRAGYVHKETAGVYAYLPLGLRVLEKIKGIVREEMDAIGGQEVLMTTLQPRDVWEKTNRWDDAVVDNWFKTKLKNGTELGVGLTHEEPIVDALTPYVDSYKDLPLYIYQIGTKFRNELRAKSGILRGREFVMKDMYSFARTQTEHTELYEKAATAYTKVYERVGIGAETYRAAADGGYFTDKYSDEYQMLSDIGEDTVLHVPETDLWYNEEIAPSKAPKIITHESEQPMEMVEGRGLIGVEPLAKFLKIPVEKTTKTMLYETDGGKIVAAAVRGGYEINEIKLRKILNVKTLKLADEATVRRVTGAEIGYAGLLNLSKEVRVIIDESCASRTNFEMGSNQTNTHTINVNWGRDLPLPKEFYDIKMARPNDIHPDSGKVYKAHRSIEVGNIFSLESKYSDALDLYYVDENGERQSIIMGCYGIGVSRIMGAIVEKFADAKGLIWPENIAPFKVYLINVGTDENVVKITTKLYLDLSKMGIEVLWDDRDVHPGEKFADADLLGIPHRVVVSPKTIQNDMVEYKARTSDQATVLTMAELCKKVSCI
ncbi:proline--tRNA ligase [Candidatus Saccharibacteria bacterium]|nr:proline--tRNA ligase [Candidatus Saccharibacteria bacterium]